MWNDQVSMLAGALVLLLAQGVSCEGNAVAAMRAAHERAQWFDLSGAADQFDATAAKGCTDARIAALYLRSLQTARDAYRTGGDRMAVAPVNAAIAALEQQTRALPSPSQLELVRIVLMAAVAAAQSERDDLQLLLSHALSLERQLLAAGAAAAPGVSAHEAAGDLWFQVHRFDAARAAYQAAGELIGPTPRVRLGMARTAMRLKDMTAACRAYRTLVDDADVRSAAAVELTEARAFLLASCAGR